MISVVGLMAISIAALPLYHEVAGSARAEAYDSAYGAPTIAAGIGLLIAGIGLARRPVLPGPGRWIVLVLGVYVFVPMLPALFDPPVLGRLALGVWMALFAGLGFVVMRAGRNRSRSSSPPSPRRPRAAAPKHPESTPPALG